MCWPWLAHLHIEDSIVRALGRECMILRIGIDIVQVERISHIVDRWGERFLRRVYTPAELRACRNRLPSLAARFAAKEAVLKALGTGLSRGITWRDVEVAGSGQAPQVRLYGQALAWAREQGIHQWTLSLSHDGGIAVAVAVGFGATPDVA